MNSNCSICYGDWLENMGDFRKMPMNIVRIDRDILISLYEASISISTRSLSTQERLSIQTKSILQTPQFPQHSPFTPYPSPGVPAPPFRFFFFPLLPPTAGLPPNSAKLKCVPQVKQFASGGGSQKMLKQTLHTHPSPTTLR